MSTEKLGATDKAKEREDSSGSGEVEGVNRI